MFLLVEDLEHQPQALLDVEGVGEGRDARRVLAAVLDRQQALVDLGGDVTAVGAEDADEAAHERPLAASRRIG